MSDVRSDAFVFFGATGDLAYKKIFPALQAMAKRGHLDVPIIGVAKSDWNLEQFQARARESVEKHGGLEPAASQPVKGCGCEGATGLPLAATLAALLRRRRRG